MVKGKNHYKILKKGIGEITQIIKKTNKELNEFGVVIDYGYLLNAVINDRELNLSDLEKEIAAYIFFESRKEKE